MNSPLKKEKGPLKNCRSFWRGVMLLLLGVMGIGVCQIFWKNFSSWDRLELHTSVLTDADSKVPPFDGLVPPIQQMPDWLTLGPDKWNLTYDQVAKNLLLDVPSYDPAVLKIPQNSLDANKASDRIIFNTKTFYLVPYLGDYKFDGLEDVGSHTGVDERALKGTPVHAIANGKVVQVAFDTIGFGTHIVVEHTDVPSFNDPHQTTTYYSTYNHLDAALVKEGDVVLKDQIIAKTGQTGYASLPHLHFQIDNDQAPFHPYWPFTLKEAADAGYTYNEAVSNGLNKDKAAATTIDPLVYIQKYRSFKAVAANLSSNQNLHTSAPKPPPSPSLAASLSAATPISASSSPTSPDTNANEWKGINVSNSLSALLLGRPFRDVAVRGDLTTALVFLKNYGVVEGNPDGTFAPTAIVSRAEAPKLILASIHHSPQTALQRPFPDVSIKDWYANFVMTAKALGMVSGYRNGLYQPAAPVSRAEFLKMLLAAWKIELPSLNKGKIMSDVTSTDWYAGEVQYAKSVGLLDAKARAFRPLQGITRGEAAILLYRLLQVQLSGSLHYAPNVAISDAKAKQFFGSH